MKLPTELPIANQNPPEAERPIGADIVYDRFLDCVHCGLCTAACPTYLETGNENDSPRGRIYLMRAVVDGKLDLSPTVERHLDLCLDCRSCETACPSGVQYGRLIEPFRVEMQQRRAEQPASATTSSAPRWFRDWILYGIFPFPGRMRLTLWPARIMQWLKLDKLAEATGLFKLMPKSLQRMQSLLPRLSLTPRALPTFLPAIGTKRAKVALFTGCVADAMFRHVHWATARVLQANGCDVIVPRGQVCCGAIHYHSGSGDPALELAETNVGIFARDDIDAVIVNVAGCGSMLKDYGHMSHELKPQDKARYDRLSRFAGKIQDVSQFLAELGLVAPTGQIPYKAAYHDACHLAHAQKVREQPRDLLAQIPGLELVPLVESDICCGAAGSYNLTEPEMSDRLSQRKLNNIINTGAEILVSANAGCTLQIQAALSRAGQHVWVAHPMEILDYSYRQQRPTW
ncbi:MAG: heterodisulfide reductase-related iron-sulfur binding cluster [Planctomycetota bacterium]|nr:heterodisulfide reductase-related iron-sulfur binding cluster [Planctomycetota bacterium]